MGRSKSSLFLMELIIVITFFAFTSAICVQLFAAANRLSTRSVGMQMAVINAQSAVETFKATDGDMNSMRILLGAYAAYGYLLVSYDENWRHTPEGGRFEMAIWTNMNTVPATVIVTVRDTFLDEELYSLIARRYLGVNP
ncbi:MAG: hypothetical protein FWE24_09440 [Defluviitaleaceae bacterium]|nr:hypothetical protein [Defluviitaleaceae bacterium]